MTPTAAPSAPGAPSRATPSRATVERTLLLVAILVVALSLRWTAAKAGLPYLQHWDEPTIAFASLEILQTGRFHPGKFHYGSLPIYLHAGVDAVHYLKLASKPRSDPEALWTLDDLEISGRSGGKPQLSHPSFVQRNRQATGVLGTLCVLFAFAFGSAVGGTPAGFFAAGLLAITSFHVRQSAMVTVDVPASTLVLSALWFCWLAWRDRAPRPLFGAAVLSGLAIACKYNTAIYLVLPAILATAGSLRRWRGFSAWLPIALPAVSVASFLVAMPYALLDLRLFLDHAAYEIHHYLVLGQGEQSVEAGWPHLAFDLEMLVRHLGIVPALVAAVGIGLALGHPAGRIVCALPLLQLLLTARTLPAFHRNVIILYPVAAIGFGVACAAGWRWLSARRGARDWATRAAVAAAVLGLAVGFVTSWNNVRKHAWPDNRSLATEWIRDHVGAPVEGDEIEANEPETTIGVAEELAVHPLDLARLPGLAVVRPTRDLVCRPSGEALVMVAVGHYPDDDQAAALDRLVGGLSTVQTFGSRHRKLRLNRYTVRPPVLVAEGSTRTGRPLACADGGIPHDELELVGDVQRNARSLGLAVGTSATTPTYRFPAGAARYAFHLKAPAGSAAVPFEVLALDVADDGEPAVRQRWSLQAAPGQRARELRLELERPTALRFRLTISDSAASGALLYGQWVATGPPDADALRSRR